MREIDVKRRADAIAKIFAKCLAKGDEKSDEKIDEPQLGIPGFTGKAVKKKKQLEEQEIHRKKNLSRYRSWDSEYIT